MEKRMNVGEGVAVRVTVVEDMRRAAVGAKDAVARFAAEVTENPGYAFRWCSDAMDAAATADVLAEVLREIDGGCSLEDAAKELTGQVLRGAEYGTHRSTSGTANVWEEKRLQAVARLARSLRDDLRWIAKDEAATGTVTP